MSRLRVSDPLGSLGVNAQGDAVRPLLFTVAAMLAGAAGLASCGGIKASEEAASAACELYIKGKLRSPSTYARISARPVLLKASQQVSVLIEYDAANAYGTPIRDRDICVFSAPEARWPSREAMEAEALASAGEDLCCNERHRAEIERSLENSLGTETMGGDMNAIGAADLLQP
jgi:hypothetical protein